jgi:hypothetical protein
LYNNSLSLYEDILLLTTMLLTEDKGEEGKGQFRIAQLIELPQSAMFHKPEK